MRVNILPETGVLIINTDLHGNLGDFHAMREIFFEEREVQDTHWVILGDLVHGPNDDARLRAPTLYDYDDRSFEIVEEVASLRQKFPDHVHLVLGNHDHAHIGGPVTRKFHHDETEFLEGSLTSSEVELLQKTLRAALLAVFAPCGLAMTHASPGRVFASLDELNTIHFFSGRGSHREVEVLRHVLQCYGQSEADSRRYLESISALLPFDVTTVVHGHDRDPEGFFIQENTQICPVIFGAERAKKRYLRVDLAHRFASPFDLRDGEEIRHLYPDE